MSDEANNLLKALETIESTLGLYALQCRDYTITALDCGEGYDIDNEFDYECRCRTLAEVAEWLVLHKEDYNEYKLF